MKCPHCKIEINPDFQEEYLGSDIQGHWSLFRMICPNPECQKFIIELALGEPQEAYRQGIVGIRNYN
jgi:hypothetical protein